jgi:hypothetical protein
MPLEKHVKKNKIFTRDQKAGSAAGSGINGCVDLFQDKFLSTKYGPNAENGYNLLWFRADWPWN